MFVFYFMLRVRFFKLDVLVCCSVVLYVMNNWFSLGLILNGILLIGLILDVMRFVNVKWVVIELNI